MSLLTISRFPYTFNPLTAIQICERKEIKSEKPTAKDCHIHCNSFCSTNYLNGDQYR
jgi:hypothetical protein